VITYLRSLPFGAWAGFMIIALGVWARDIFGVLIGGTLAVVTLIATDRTKEEPPGEDITEDERFKEL
jgi:hypothetical protein